LETRLHTRTSFGDSGHGTPKGQSAADLAQRRATAEFTLGLEDEWEDIPTAELDLSIVEESTVGFESPQDFAPPGYIPAGVSAASPDGAAADPDDPPAERSAASHSATVMKAPAALPDAATAIESSELSPLPRDITPGTLLCDRYVLGRLLGVGGSSLIFQAEDRRRVGAKDFGNRIAIKVLRPQMRANTHALTRLRREFRQMQRLSHPGIAKVYEIAHDEDVWFMTMELIEGQTLNQCLKTSTNRTQALKIVASCCEALHHAHEAGVVHGDLKPSNVLVLPTGGVKLVDFGSAAERDAAMEVIDKERSFAATPPYASPQVLAGEVADPRDDVFSLACLTYAVLTQGEHPFERKSSAEAHQAQMKPAYARGILPRQFAVLVRALAWEREQRPASVREFLHALLASDLRREGAAHGSSPISSDVASKPVHVAPSPVQELPKVVPPATPTAVVTQASACKEPVRAATNVKAEDVARLQAVVAAAEAHVERIDPGAVKDKPAPPNPLEHFKGYVAGPLAQHGDKIPAARDSHTADAPSPRRKWPWRHSVLLGLMVVAAAGSVALRVDRDREPVEPVAARPFAQALMAKPAPAPEVVQLDPAPDAAPLEEKKSHPVAMKPKERPLAAGEISFATRTLQVGANQTVAALAVKRLNSTRGRARVAWSIEEGTARSGIHYDIASPQVIEFLDGQSVRSLFIPLTPDKDTENARNSKTFTVKLHPAARGPAIGEIKQVYITIVGDVAVDKLAATASDPDAG
jgi:serine/threonine protein kinase